MSVLKKEFYTVDQFAGHFDISSGTVRTLIKLGEIRAFRSGPGLRAPYRIPVSEITRYQVVGMHKLNPNLEVEDE